MNELNGGMRSVRTAEEALTLILNDLLSSGHDVTIGDALSVGSGRRTKELTNYLISVESPNARLICNPARRLRPVLAVARFVWMMTGSDRLADIAFYDDRVRWFSDDGFSIPGSNFGQRILHPQPGINQLSAIIDLLATNPLTRRAVISIYQPGDCARNSRDIPCALSLAFHIREGHLATTTLMRSNNAFVLMPHNFFEFSLLAEVISAEIGVPLGPFAYFALSMHLYEEDFASAEEAVKVSPQAPLAIQDLPRDPRPLTQLRELAQLESELRYSQGRMRDDETVSTWIQKSSGRLHPYWHQHFLVLLFWALAKADNESACSSVEDMLSEPWKSLIGNERLALARMKQK